jgi:hypothetical protein
MTPEIEAMRKQGHLGTFVEARKWVRAIKMSNGEQPFELEFIPPAYYAVLQYGAVVGTGMTYEEAIDGATKEVRSNVYGQFGLRFDA